jgi:hypothetical protein
VIPGNYDIEIARVRVRAEGAETSLTNIVFTQQGGATLSSVIDSAYLETAAGQRLAGASIVGDRLEFQFGNNTSNYRLSSGGFIDLVVKARVRDAGFGQSIRLDLGRYSDSSRNISQGVGALRTGDNSRVVVSGYITGPVITINSSASGNVRATVSLSSASPNSLTISPSSVETEIARFDIAASNDSLRLTDLYLQNLGTLDLSARARSLSFYDGNGAFIGRGFIVGSRVIHLSLGASSNFVIARNTTRSISLRAAFELNNSASSSDNGGTIRLQLSSSNVSTVDGTVSGIRLISENNGFILSTPSITSDTTSEHRVVATRSYVGFGGSFYTSEAFSLGVPSDNQLFLRKVRATIAVPFNGPTAYTLYRDRETSGNVVAQGFLNAGSTSVMMDLTNAFPGGLEISAGTTKAFVIVFSGGNPSSGSRVTRLESLEYATEFGTIIDTAGYSNLGLPVESIYRY